MGASAWIKHPVRPTLILQKNVIIIPKKNIQQVKIFMPRRWANSIFVLHYLSCSYFFASHEIQLSFIELPFVNLR